MGNQTSVDREHNEIQKLQIYQKLISMGFNDENALLSATKCPTNLQNATEYAIEHENDSCDGKLEGFIMMIMKDNKVVECWCELHKAIIKVHLGKDDITDIPYDVINVSEYTQIEKCGDDHEFVYFGLKILHENGDEKLLAFRNTHDRFIWHKSLEKYIGNKYQTIKQNIDHIIYNSWSLVNKKLLLFMQLTYDDSNLYFYDNNMKLSMIINLCNYSDIICYDAIAELKIDFEDDSVMSILRKSWHNGVNAARKDHRTSFKYGLVLREKHKIQSNDRLLLFKSNNQRHEWMAHLSFLFQNKTKNDNNKTIAANNAKQSCFQLTIKNKTMMVRY
eukprot:93563_1